VRRGCVLAFAVWLAVGQPAFAIDLITPDIGHSTARPYINDFSADVDSVEQRLNAVQHLKNSLSPEMLTGFRLFIYVNKAAKGPFAQRMYVAEKTDVGDLALLYDWAVSTGRENDERDTHGQVRSSLTPVGYYELDPKRLYVKYISSQWDERMPYAMFFNWRPKGLKTGLAIHGVDAGSVSSLGIRASAGCVRLSVENAGVLFALIRSRFRGPTPRLVYRVGDKGVSSLGLLLHNAKGGLEQVKGYSVLILIDNFGDPAPAITSTDFAASGRISDPGHLER
jgi:hypothetical protein